MLRGLAAGKKVPSMKATAKPQPSSPRALKLAPCWRSFVDTRSDNGHTALHLAALSGTLPCMHALLAGGASMLVRPLPSLRAATGACQPCRALLPLHVAEGWVSGGRCWSRPEFELVHLALLS